VNDKWCAVAVGVGAVMVGKAMEVGVVTFALTPLAVVACGACGFVVMVGGTFWPRKRT
jgi:predicted anti-sigma-YlaC factor YlaD